MASNPVIKKPRIEQSSPLTFVLVEEIDERKTEDYMYGISHAITSITNFGQVQRIILPKDAIDTSSVNTPYIVNRHILMSDGTVRVPANTIMFETKMPVYDEEIKNNFTNPPDVTIEDVLQKNPGTRVSVIGQISKVSNLIESPNSRRKIIKITNDAGTNLEVKLWGAKSTLDVEVSPMMVRIKCVQISIYNGIKSLNSTVNTIIETIEDEQVIEGEVIGARFDGDDSYLLMDRIYKIKQEMLKLIYPSNKFEENKYVSAKCRGNTITSIITNTRRNTEETENKD